MYHIQIRGAFERGERYRSSIYGDQVLPIGMWQGESAWSLEAGKTYSLRMPTKDGLQSCWSRLPPTEQTGTLVVAVCTWSG